MKSDGNDKILKRRSSMLNGDVKRQRLFKSDEKDLHSCLYRCVPNVQYRDRFRHTYSWIAELLIKII